MEVIVLIGPSAVGKSEIGFLLAKEINAEIISCDSRKIYRYLDIGTAKPPLKYRTQVPHYMIDIIDPDEDYSAGRYAREARQKAKEILSKGKKVLVVGGSGLYLRAFLDGLVKVPPKDEKIREALKERAKKEGREALYYLLEKCDPETAEKTHPHNLPRVIRALEIYLLTGQPISYFWKSPPEPAPFKFVIVGLNCPKEILKERISTRVERMLEQGLVQEVEGILQKGYSPSLFSLHSVGYKEIIEYLEGKISYHEAINKIKHNTFLYTKRQLTWFRKDTRIHWFNTIRGREETAEEVLSFLKKGDF